MILFYNYKEFIIVAKISSSSKSTPKAFLRMFEWPLILIGRYTYLGATDDAVCDNTLEGIYRASLFVTSVPHLNSDAEAWFGWFTSDHLHDSDVNWEVTKVLLDLSSWTFDNDHSGLAWYLDYITQKRKHRVESNLPSSGILTNASLRITLMFQKNAYIFFY